MTAGSGGADLAGAGSAEASSAGAGSAGAVPLWLLDVDGVLNAVAIEPDYQVWPRWQRGLARTDGLTRAWPIQWAPDVVEHLLRWHAEGRVEIAWLTTWGPDANEELAELLGLPQLPVAGAPPSRIPPSPDTAADGGGASTHAALAGADAADPLTGRWWKFDVLRRVLAADPRRPIIWTDDDLAAEPAAMAWMRVHTTSLLIAPDPRCGLVPQHLRAIERFLPPPAAHR